MSRMLETEEKLRDTQAAIAHLESAIAEAGNSFALELMAGSLRKRRDVLEEQFLASTNEVGVDVCSYRLFGDGERPKVAGVASALLDFQTLFSVTVDAMKNGPKQTSKVAAEIISQTAFDFAYSFSGSVGIVFSVPNNRLLFGDADLDAGINVLFEMFKARTAADLSAFARHLGPAPIRLLYRWVSDHLAWGLGAEIEWRRGHEVRSTVLAQLPDFRRLRAELDAAGEERTEEIRLIGELVGADTHRKSFHMLFPGGGEVRGSFSDAIREDQTVELPHRYLATIRVTRQLKYSTDREEESYFLLRLEPVAEQTEFPDPA